MAKQRHQSGHQLSSFLAIVTAPVLVLIIVLCTLLPALTAAQNDGMPPIGTIDIYGHRTLTDEEVREALGFKEGDYSLPQLNMLLGPQLARKLGVARVQLDGTCCDEDGNVLVFVGIDETGTNNLSFRSAPTGDIRLPTTIYETFLAFNAAVRTASLSNNPTEDLSSGHALISDPAARKEQEMFLVFGAENLNVLQRVLRESSNQNHRAAAAYVIGYAPNKQDVVPYLIEASMDPFNSVRTNATRALGAIATLATNQPELGIDIPVDNFIDMLNSVIYADRRMGVTVLSRLSAAREPRVLAELRKRALPSLVEMSLWSYTGHSYAPYQILGRIVGLTEDEIEETFEIGRNAIIEQAIK